ncbi:MAG: magnesium transporter CorA [Proteobacteria bacterium]|nr:magnesium transporter CorA [Pseudomonadota bacterium]
MITCYNFEADAIQYRQLEGQEPLSPKSIWIDILNPTQDEEESIEQQLNIQIPTREEIWKNEVLNRFYEQDGVYYMTLAIITKVDTPYPQTSTVTIILSKTYLITLRYITPTSFNNFAARLIKKPKKFNTCSKILEGLLEEVITRVAHNAEIVVGELDNLSHQVFGTHVLNNARKKKAATSSEMLKDTLKSLGKCADLNSKIGESLHSLQRLLNFFCQIHGGKKDLEAAIQILQTDVHALSQQTHFLSNKINFLQDATLGMINIEQNMIIKIFSVMAVFFLPPTLLSSIYGMNFKHMPELEWTLGYPYALSLMVVCAILSYVYFLRKGWL